MKHVVPGKESIAMRAVMTVGVALSAVFPLTTEAQQVAEKDPPEDKAASLPPSDDPEPNDRGQGAESAMEARLAEMEKMLNDQSEQIRALNARDADKDAELSALKDEITAQAEFSEAFDEPIEEENKYLSFWGFYDLTFVKRFYDEGSPYNIYLFNKSSFVLTGVNLYLKSQLTDTFSVLMETNFSLLPSVTDEELEYEGLDSEYHRRNTTVTNPQTSKEFNLGGVVIERLHLTWAPRDWFKVLAGKYLTPFGIWNIDHGSPVVIPIDLPYFHLREMIVPAQTGLMVFGRFFPTSKIYMDYAITLSNGRGPTAEVFDLDENKAVGLRLHLTYDHNTDVKVEAGGYGYLGTKKDQKKIVRIDLDADMPIRIDMEDVYDAREIAASADIKLSAYGVVLQGEYVWHRIDFTDTYPMEAEWVLMNGGSVEDAISEGEAEMWYVPSYSGYSVYGLVAYTLPLDKWISPATVTPYVYFEKNVSYDVIPHANQSLFWAGINVKPKPFLTLKGQYTLIIPETDSYGSNMHSLTFQMAVSF